MTRPLDQPELHLHLALALLLAFLGSAFPSFKLRLGGRLGKGETVVFTGEEEQERSVCGELAKSLGEGTVGRLSRGTKIVSWDQVWAERPTAQVLGQE